MFVVIATNRGNVEHRFSRISLRVRGLKKDQTPSRREDQRLDFPESVLKAELVPAEFGYFFVRPGIDQRFTFTTTMPDDIRFILARPAFQYQHSEDLHTCERVFAIDPQ
jgi:hypothetical protein